MSTPKRVKIWFFRLLMSQSSGCVSLPAYLIEQAAEDVAHVILKDQFLLVEPFQQLPAQAVNRLALLVHHVVVFEQVFAGLEVLPFDGLLRCLDAPRDHLRLDGHALFHAQPLQQVRHPLLGEDAHQIVFQRQVEARCAGIALTAGASAQLVVDAARLVTFGAEDEQPAEIDDFVVFGVGGLLVAL